MFHQKNIPTVTSYIQSIDNHQLISCLYAIKQEKYRMHIVEKKIMQEIKTRLADVTTAQSIHAAFIEAKIEEKQRFFYEKIRYLYQELIVLMEIFLQELDYQFIFLKQKYIQIKQIETLQMNIKENLLSHEESLNSLKKHTPYIYQQILPLIKIRNICRRSLKILKRKNASTASMLLPTLNELFISLHNTHENNKQSDLNIIKKYSTTLTLHVLEIIDLTFSIVSCLAIIGIGWTLARAYHSHLTKGHYHFWQHEPKSAKIEKIMTTTKKLAMLHHK